MTGDLEHVQRTVGRQRRHHAPSHRRHRARARRQPAIAEQDLWRSKLVPPHSGQPRGLPRTACGPVGATDGWPAPVLRQRRASRTAASSWSAVSTPTSRATPTRAQTTTRGARSSTRFEHLVGDEQADTWVRLHRRRRGLDRARGRARTCSVRSGQREDVRAQRYGTPSPTRGSSRARNSEQSPTRRWAAPTRRAGACCPNGNVLTVQIFSATATQNAEMYVPANDEWVSAGVTLLDAARGIYRRDNFDEIGGAVTPDQRHVVLRRRQRPHRDLHVRRDADGEGDLGGRTRPSRRRRQRQCARRTADLARRRRRRSTQRPRARHWGPVDPGGQFSRVRSRSATQPRQQHAIGTVPQPSSAPGHTWQCAFLLLPNGHVLMSGEQNTINEYVPDAAELTPKASGAPRSPRHRRRLSPVTPTRSLAPSLTASRRPTVTAMTGRTPRTTRSPGSPTARATSATCARRTSPRWVSPPAPPPSLRHARCRRASRPGRGTSGRGQRHRLGPDPGAFGHPRLLPRHGPVNRGQGEVQALISLNGAPARHHTRRSSSWSRASPRRELGLTAATSARHRYAPTFRPPVQWRARRPARPGVAGGPALPPNVPQRFTFPYALSFADSMFSFTGPTEDSPSPRP